MKKTDKLFRPGDIEYYVAQHIRNNRRQFKDKVCIDTPAGQGVTSRVLFEVGAKIKAYDIFPEYYKFDKVKCEYADLTKKLPVPDNSADCIICQEGFEHISDQLAVFKEFNRVLKKGGRLLVTVPNYSNIKSRLSYLFFESECYGRDMPINEIDTVWHAQDDAHTNEMYYGHAFLIGIQKLRFLGKVSGFSIVNTYKTKLNKTSLFFFPIIFPFIFIVALRTYIYAMGKKGKSNTGNYKSVYRECLRLNLRPDILLRKNLFVEFKKLHTLDAAGRILSAGKKDSPWETISSKQKIY